MSPGLNGRVQKHLGRFQGANTTLQRPNGSVAPSTICKEKTWMKVIRHQICWKGLNQNIHHVTSIHLDMLVTWMKVTSIHRVFHQNRMLGDHEMDSSLAGTHSAKQKRSVSKRLAASLALSRITAETIMKHACIANHAFPEGWKKSEAIS